MLIIARIESFILGKSLNDAVNRAEAYSKAGADAILIHSKEKNLILYSSLPKDLEKVNFINPWSQSHLLTLGLARKI